MHAFSHSVILKVYCSKRGRLALMLLSKLEHFVKYGVLGLVGVVKFASSQLKHLNVSDCNITLSF